MNREIKFRVWDTNELAMKYDRYALYIHGTLFALAYGDAQFEVADPIIMQYIGIKDKNNKEIYEGDIIRSHYLEGGVSKLGIVVYRPRRAAFMLDHQDGSFSSFHGYTFKYECIGNILENTELILEKI